MRNLEPIASVIRREPRWWLHLLLLLLTIVSTTIFGFALFRSFYSNQPFQSDLLLEGYDALLHGRRELWIGLPFSLCVIGILLVHELGHYIACQRWQVNASLPYFIPFPSLIGTLGAFIRIRSPIYTRRSLFDIGISGPLAGFIALLPVLAVGIALSRVVPGIAAQGDVIFGTPLLLRIAEWIRFPGVPVADISLHPIARAAWAGLLATAINLMPIGQLDGGHILYSLVGELHRPLSRLFLVLLLPLAAFFTWAWLVWAILLFFFGMRHPLIYDTTAVDRRRIRLGWCALAILLLSFSLVPVH